MGEGALRTERVKVRDECPEEAKEVYQHKPLTNYNAPCLRIRHACTTVETNQTHKEMVTQWKSKTSYSGALRQLVRKWKKKPSRTTEFYSTTKERP